MYLLNEEAYHLFIASISKYKNAMTVNLHFIKAFSMLRKHYELHNDNRELLMAIVNTDEYGKLSEVNGLPRTNQVKAYTRSKKGKKLFKRINRAIKMIQLSLFSNKEISNK